MQCTVLLFAQVREALGADRLTIELESGATVRDALDQLAEVHPTIAPMRATLAAAVNDRYARPATTLSDGDTLALIPPVSGG